ncbi:MAG: biotin/lipoyl-binding protein [Rhodopseudomonas palustris]|nr:biotin/lipoyl-binding protein [Rhodopseudomonas palustris]
MKQVEQSMEFVGRVNAVGKVEVRARVKGYLEAVLFKEGDTIRQGTPLYRIEKGQFEGDVKQAEGAYLRGGAAKELSAIQLKRSEELLDQSGQAQPDRSRSGSGCRPAGAGTRW